ncbi:MAG: hypothetical protein ACYTFI_26465, partial [Planctomycetota bacterium]
MMACKSKGRRRFPGGVELRFGIAGRVTERQTTLRAYLGELGDAAKTEAKRSRLAEIGGLLRSTFGPEADRLRNEKAEIELALDGNGLADELADLRRRAQAVGECAGIVRKRLDPKGREGIQVLAEGSSHLLVRVPFRGAWGEEAMEEDGPFQERLE